jgi:hypothetical protein
MTVASPLFLPRGGGGGGGGDAGSGDPSHDDSAAPDPYGLRLMGPGELEDMQL